MVGRKCECENDFWEIVHFSRLSLAVACTVQRFTVNRGVKKNGTTDEEYADFGDHHHCFA